MGTATKIESTLNLQTYYVKENDIDGLWAKECLDRGCIHKGFRSWAYDLKVADPFEVLADHVEFLGTYMTKTTRDAFFMLDDLLCLMETHGGIAYFTVASEDLRDFAPVWKRLKELLPSPVLDPEDKIVPFTFWNNSPTGPMSAIRNIEVETWDDIKGNYSAEIASKMETLLKPELKPHTGTLMLWRGPAGTGKTWGIRSLSWEWREWAKFLYIIDPEEFFGRSPAYMVKVLMGNEDTNGKYNVLILEDSGDLLTMDANHQVGKAFGRLLNIVDGLVGQGLKIITLITTNEHLSKIHPAVLRPGRCLANMNFDALDCADANAWLKAHDVDHTAKKAMTLAQLYSLERGIPLSEDQKVGF